jgi:hypothetical protein
MTHTEMMSADISKLAEALSKFQGSVSGVIKDKIAKAGSYSYKYADLAGVWDVVRKPLSENGLSVTQTYFEHENHILLITMLLHSSGQWIRSILRIMSNGLKIQQIGSEMTYNRRYALTAILGIAADDDDDGATANEQPRAKTAAKEKPSVEEDGFITEEQFKQIESNFLPGCEEYRTNLLKYFSVRVKANPPLEDFKRLPKSCFESCMKSVMKKKEEVLRQQESMQKLVEEMPF